MAQLVHLTPIRTSRPTTKSSAPPLWREILLVAVFYGAYTLVRLLIPHNEPGAFAHAGQIVRIERALGLDFELSLNQALLHHASLAKLANLYYATAHFAITLIVLVWLYRRRPDVYRWMRTSLMVATAVALAGFWLYPLAPPRFLGTLGFVDPVTAFHSFGLYSSPEAGAMTNQFAAMPSMHAGWALWCAAAIVMTTRRPWLRAAAVLYPVVTVLVIFATANHFVLDAVAGVGITTFALVGTAFAHRRSASKRPPKDHEVTNKTRVGNNTASTV